MRVSTRLYRAADRQAFVDLNRDWIEEYFVLEASDREQLEELEASIRNGRAGGRHRRHPAAAS